MAKVLLTWVALLALLALEIGVSFLPMSPDIRPVILLPALGMLAVIAGLFMQIGRGLTIVRLFAAAGLLWLMILLGLGSLDPLTRTDYPIKQFVGSNRQ
jgi:cytochrome c oxidase subunit 4